MELKHTGVQRLKDGGLPGGTEVKTAKNTGLQRKVFRETIKINCLERCTTVRYKYLGRLLVCAVLARLSIIASFRDQKGKEAL